MAEAGDRDPFLDDIEGDQEEREDGVEADPHAPRRRRARALAGEIPLEGLLRLLAGQRVIIERRDGASNNEELISGLKRSGAFNSESVMRAMLICPRGSFVPENYRAEAWVDSPIRVEEEDFNISAPHMHAQLLESLELSVGDRVLDVGCGCGYIAACAAVLVGTTGCVLGVDTKTACVKLAQDNMARLREASKEFAAAAAPVTVFKHNVFIPHAKLKGKFNKVCVGATCPEDRVHLLLHLLEPSGGKLLAPVDSDLRLYTKAADGTIRHRLVSSVRFSDLEVPSDASIALAVLHADRAAQVAVTVSPPTLAEDLQTSPQPGCGGVMHMWSKCFNSFSTSTNTTQQNLQTDRCSLDSDTLPPPDTPVIRNHKSGIGGSTAAAEAGGSAGADADPADSNTHSSEKHQISTGSDLHDTHMAYHSSNSSKVAQPWLHPAAAGLLQQLGEPDCELVGPGWELQAHKQLLRGRAAHFRARLSSGMRDAHDCQHKVPEGFGLAAMQDLLLYLYTDELAPGLEPSAVVGLLHAAAYYGTPRLIELCEGRLVSELLQLAPAAAAAEAPHLLCLADELGLVQLRRAAVAFIAQHFKEVQASEGWPCLDRSQVELVASQVADELGRLTGLLKELEPPTGAAAVPKRRSWW